MKKTVILSLGAVLLLSSCGTYTGSGAYAGASLGSILGSAVGGISGGWRGSDIGTIVGMAGGAAVGAAIGSQADKQEAEQVAQDRATFNERYQQHRSAATNSGYDDGNYNDNSSQNDSGYDPNGGGDDVLYDFHGEDYTGNYSASAPQSTTPSVRYDALNNEEEAVGFPLEIRNARFVDDNQDHKLNGGELGKVIFEVYNRSSKPVYDVQPMVVEVTGNKQIAVSGTIHVEKIAPKKGVRYTAMVKAGKRIKDGNATFRVYAVQGNNNAASEVSVFNIATSRK